MDGANANANAMHKTLIRDHNVTRATKTAKKHSPFKHKFTHEFRPQDNVPLQIIVEEIQKGLTTKIKDNETYNGTTVTVNTGAVAGWTLHHPQHIIEVQVDVVVPDGMGPLPFYVAKIFAQYCMARMCQFIGDHILKDGPGPVNPSTQISNALQKLVEQSNSNKTKQIIKTDDRQHLIEFVNANKIRDVGDDIAQFSMRDIVNAYEIRNRKLAVYAMLRTPPNDLLSVSKDNHVLWTRSNKQTNVYGPYKRIYCAPDSKLCENPAVSNLFQPHRIPRLSPEYDAIKALANGFDVTLFGYGYSGSGKTYNLLGDDRLGEGRLRPILVNVSSCKLKYVFEESPGGTLDFNVDELNYDGRVILLYGDLVAFRSSMTGVKVLDRRENKTTIPEKNGAEEIIKYIKGDITDQRKGALRIRASLNNGESSRTHMYIVIEVVCGEHTSRLTMIDLGGIETPASMLKNAVDNVEKARDVPGVNVKKYLRDIFSQSGVHNITHNSLSILKNMGQKMETIQKSIVTDTSNKAFFKHLAISDWVNIYARVRLAVTDSAEIDEINEIVKGLNRGRGGHTLMSFDVDERILTKNPPCVMYPLDSQRQPIFKPDFGGDQNMKVVQGEYYSLLHVAALYIEGSYIQESLSQLSGYLLENCTTNCDQYQQYNKTVITRAIFTNMAADRKGTRYIMFFTLDPTTLERNADDTPGYFTKSADIVQQCCSTATRPNATSLP